MIATAVTVPLIVVAALLIDTARGGDGHGSTSPGPLPPVSVPAPESSDAKTVSACANVISALPLVLAGQNLRRTVSSPASPSIVAWGDPAIVLRCGVTRPASLHPGSNDLYPSVLGPKGPYYDVTKSGDANVWTTVDRAVYIAITVPTTYNSAPLTPVSQAIAKVLPAVCEGGQKPVGTTDQSKLCASRP